TGRIGTWLMAALVATFFAHALAFCVAALVCGAVNLGKKNWSPAMLLRTQWPLLGTVPLILPWYLWFAGKESISKHPEQWWLGPNRVWAFPGMLLSIGSADRLATGFGLCLLVVVALSLGPPTKLWPRSLLLVFAIALYLFLPFELRGVAFLYQR